MVGQHDRLLGPAGNSHVERSRSIMISSIAALVVLSLVAAVAVFNDGAPVTLVGLVRIPAAAGTDPCCSPAQQRSLKH
jgi:hypothetical protein